MYWFSCYKVLKFCMVYSLVQTETKLLYDWVIGISVCCGNKYQVKNLYAWVKMIKGGKDELQEQPTSVICLMFLAPLAKGQQAIVMALCPSCVCPSISLSVCLSVSACVRKLFLQNTSPQNFYEISQKCSLGGPLSNSFK